MNGRWKSFLLAAVLMVLTTSPAIASDLHIMFVFDNSGSMAGEKLAQAKKTLERSLQLLPPGTVVGILVFSSSHRWYYEPDKLDVRRAIRIVQGIDDGGGTALGNAIEEASRQLEILQSKYMGHNGEFRIIALTDGENTDGSRPEYVIPNVARRQQRMDVIGIELTDQTVVDALASNGFKNAYHTVDNVDRLFSVMKKVLNLETVGTGKDGVNDFDLIAGIDGKTAQAIIDAVVQVSKTEQAQPSSARRGGGDPNAQNAGGCQSAPMRAGERNAAIVYTLFVLLITWFVLRYSPPDRRARVQARVKKHR